MNVREATVASPVGDLRLAAEGNELVRVVMRRRNGTAAAGSPDDEVLAEAARQLAEYFGGSRREFRLRLRAEGEAFDVRVWELLREIPYGRTWSYGEVARRLGDASLARDVGAAAGRNPLPIVVPCHRVVGADGSLVGYGGGLARKRFLLDLEEPAEKKAGRLFQMPAFRVTG